MATVIFDKLRLNESDTSKSLSEFLAVKGIDCSVYITSNGKLVQKTDILENGRIYHIIPRVLGGKGGFGSMLRSIGAQIEKTTNREACRDLSGRRMRDVNNEQHLRDWVAQKAAREREREKRRKERAEKRRQALTDRRHNFDDPDYHSQKMKVLERLDDALRQGFLNKKSSSTDGAAEAATAAAASPVDTPSTSQPGTSGTKKRKATNGNDKDGELHTKRACEWLGIDLKDLSGLDSESDESSVNQSGDEEASTNDTDMSEAKGSNIAAKGSESEGSGKENGANCEKTMKTDDASQQPANCESVQEKLSDPEQKEESLKAAEKKVGLLEKLTKVPPNEDKKETEGPINLEDYSSAVELEDFGLERLKTELMSMGLKCGGTLQQRAERLWAVKGKSKEEIDPSFFAKPSRHKKK